MCNIEGTRISDFATSMVSLLNQLDVTPIAVIGHSMGAMTAIDIASRGDFIAIMLLSASLKTDFGSESPISRAIRSLRDPIDPSVGFLREWYACAVPVDPDFLMKKVDAAAMPAAIWHGVLEGFASTDLTQNAVQITAPVLCIGGSSDPLFGLSHRRALPRAFKSARSITLEGHGHNPHWEAPQLVAKHLLSFLSEIRGSLVRMNLVMKCGDHESDFVSILERCVRRLLPIV